MAEQNGLLMVTLVSAWRLAMDVLWSLNDVLQSLQIWLKLRSSLPYPNSSNCLNEGLLRAKLSMMFELSNDRSRVFFQMTVLAKRREIHQQGKFAVKSVSLAVSRFAARRRPQSQPTSSPRAVAPSP